MADDSQIHPYCHLDASNSFFSQLDIQLLIHELKGPLSVIINNNRMLVESQHRYGSLNAFQECALKRALRSTAKLNDIVQSMLEVGSSETGQFKLSRFDIVHSATKILVDLVESETCQPIGTLHDDAHDIAQRLEYLEVNGIVMDTSPTVQGLVLHQDEAKLGRILANLVRNALQHKKARVVVQMALRRPNLEICVIDDGQGIALEDLPGLFECYTQNKACRNHTRARGHGLGWPAHEFWRVVLAAILRSIISAGPVAVSWSTFPLNVKPDKSVFRQTGPLAGSPFPVFFSFLCSLGRRRLDRNGGLGQAFSVTIPVKTAGKHIMKNDARLL